MCLTRPKGRVFFCALHCLLSNYHAVIRLSPGSVPEERRKLIRTGKSTNEVGDFYVPKRGGTARVIASPRL